MRVALVMHPEPEGEGAQDLRGRWGLGARTVIPEGWVLIDPDGHVAMSGRDLPSPEMLQGALERRGHGSPVIRLKRFLARHPEHLEARRDLILALVARLRVRLAEHPRPPDGEFPPDQDLAIWGELAREFDCLMQNDRWVLVGAPPLHWLPTPITPEGWQKEGPSGQGSRWVGPDARSPLMRGLARRHWPKVVEVLQRMPDWSDGWITLLRMAEMLGPEAPPFPMEILASLGDVPGSARGLDYVRIGFHLQVEARRRGHWGRVAPLLERLWWEAAAPSLAGDLRFSVGPDRRRPTGEEVKEARSDHRKAVWSTVLAPLLESLVRSGREGEVIPILRGLDEGWSFLTSDGRVSRLAREVGRADLDRTWREVLQAGRDRETKAPVLREGSRTIWVRQGVHSGEVEVRFSLALQGAGIEAEWSAPDPALARRLGWSDGELRWAVLDSQSLEVLAQGDQVPNPGALAGAWSLQGGTTPEVRMAGHLQRNPRHLSVRARLAGRHQIRARALLEWRLLQAAPSGSPGPASEAEREAWRAYFRESLDVLEDPVGSCPWLLRLPGLSPLPLPKPMHGEVPGAAGFAHQVLPIIEGALSDRPCDGSLWSAWVGLVPLAPRDPGPFLDSLQPSPEAISHGWPRMEVLRFLAGVFSAEERWETVIALLEPRWKLEQRSERGTAMGRGSGNLEDPALVRALFESYVRSGRREPALRMFQALDPEARGRLQDLVGAAKELGMGGWERD